MLRVTLFQGRRPVFQGNARQVVLPGEDGEVSVLGYHAPMLCVLGEGRVQIDELDVPVQGGLACVTHNAVTIVTPLSAEG